MPPVENDEDKPEKLFAPPPISEMIDDSDLSIASDSKGNKVAAWVEEERVLVSQLPAQGTWSAPEVLSTPLEPAYSPKVEMDKDTGEATVVWLEEDQIGAASKPLEGDWVKTIMKPTLVEIEEHRSEEQKAPDSKSRSKRFAIGVIPSELKDFHSIGFPKIGSILKKGSYPGDGSIGDKYPIINPKGETDGIQLEDSLANAIDAPTGGTFSGGQIGFAAGTAAPSNGLVVAGNVGILTSSATDPLTIGIVNSSTGQLIRVNGTVAAQSYMGFFGNTTRQGYIGTAGGSGGFVVNSDVTSLLLKGTLVPVYLSGTYTGVSTGLSVGGTYYTTIPPTDGAIIQGRMGLGVNAATYYLDIVPTSVSDGIRVKGGVTNLQLILNNSSGTTGSRSFALTNNSGFPATIFQLLSDADAFSANLMGVFSNSGVGIGSSYATTTPPASGAIIQGQTFIGSTSQLDANTKLRVNNTGTAVYLDITGDANQQQALRINDGTANWIVYKPASVSTRMNIFSGSDLFGFFTNGGLSIGTSYATTTPPANGAIIQGIVGIGTSSPDLNGTVNIYCGGTKTTTSSGFGYGIIEGCTFTPASGAAGDLRGISSQPTFNAPTGQTIAAAMGMFSSIIPNTAGNTGTITTAYGMLISTGSAPAAGTVTMGYGLHVLNPAYGNTKCATYTDNLSVGYGGTAPPSSGAIILGSVGIGTSTTVLDLQIGGTGIGLGMGFSTHNVGVWWNSYYNGLYRGITTGQYAGSLLLSGSGDFLFSTSNGSTVTAGASFTPVNVIRIAGTGGVSIGTTYSGTAPPTNGAIIQGILGVGTSSPDTTGVANIQCAGTKTNTNGGFAYSTILTTTFTPTAGAVGDLRGLSSQCTFNAPTGQTVAFAEGIFAYLTPNTTGNTGTISNAVGVYVAGGVAPASGTVSNGYGLYVENPAYGTVKCATYTNNLSVGYSGVTPPSTGAIIQGAVSIGTNSPGGYMFNVTVPDSTSYAIGGGVVGAMRGTTGLVGATDQAGFFVACNLKPSGTIGFSMQEYIYPQFNASLATSTTIPITAGLFINDGNLASGTVTSAYGGYIRAPAFGTNRCATFTENLSVGYTATTPPTSGAIISGSVGIGTSGVTNGFVSIVSPSNTTKNSMFFGGTQVGSGTNASVNIIQQVATISPNFSGTLGDACAGIYVFNTFAPASGCTVPAACGIITGAGASGGAGSISAGYGLYAVNPAYGTAKCAIYGENLSIGYPAVSPPTSGAIISGKVAIGQSSVGTDRYIQLSPLVVNTASNYGVVIDGYMGASSGTIAESTVLYVNPLFSSNAATVTNAYAVHINGGATGAVITNGFGMKIEPVIYADNRYGIWVDAPTGGTNRTTATFGGSASNIVILGTGDMYPVTTKTVICGKAGNAWTSVTAGSFPVGTSRIAKSQKICSKCGELLMRGTGTLIVLGESADYIPCWCCNDLCANKGVMHMDEIKHLPSAKLVERRPPPKIEFRGFRVFACSGNSCITSVDFRYVDPDPESSDPSKGEVVNSTYLTDVEYAEFIALDENQQKEYLYRLGLREWNAIEEHRLIKEVQQDREDILNGMAAKWRHTDLMK